MNKIENMPEYNKDAIKKWDEKNVADPWVVATALIEKATIVTHESRVFGGLEQKSKRVKIPDVAKKFGIKCINLFEFMRIENIILR